MRLASLEVGGFRGFAETKKFDLQADVVVIVGANGNGKTSIFDAILWAVSGRVPRFGGDDSLLACKFPVAGETRVVLRLEDTVGGPWLAITRVFDGSSTRVSVETPDGVIRGPEAEGRIIHAVWREAGASADPAAALATVLTRSVYLQQDQVREFIDAATPQERYSAVSELIGAGRVAELQVELERGKRAWSVATNARATELEPLRARLASMESRLVELRARSIPEGSETIEDEWQTWWKQLEAMGFKPTPHSMESREAATAIDSAIKQLDARRAAGERRRLSLATLASELTERTAALRPDVAPLRASLAAAREQVEATRTAVQAEQARVAEVRRQQAELSERAEQLRALAGLALKHLGDRCPVCDQELEIEATRHRLETLVREGGQSSTVAAVTDSLPSLLANLSLQEQEQSAAEWALRTAEQLGREADAKEATIARRLKELGIDSEVVDEQPALVAAAIVEADRQIEGFLSAQRAGEPLALRLSYVRDAAMSAELQGEIEALRAKIEGEDVELAKREATGVEAQEVIEALRTAGSRVVADRVKEIEPLLSDIYGRVDVHPAFRAVRFLTSVVRGRGQLSAAVGDPHSDVECDTPETVLSSSQLNALAVCVFLSLNLGAYRSPIDAAILDDPLQSLDDINLLGLVDLLRQAKERRQLLVSTHDARFGKLLARKLRPRTVAQRTTVIELDGWSRTGPTVSIRDVSPDPVPLRLVATGSAA